MRLKLFTAVFALALRFSLVADPICEALSLEEKIGQMMMVHFDGETANESAASFILEEHVGGVILFNWSNGLTSPVQVKTLTDGLQTIAQKTRHALPLLIAADQEGGFVVRLTEGFIHFPGNKAAAMAGNPCYAGGCAFAMGLEQLAVGINMTLAPVVDVAAKGKGSVIGVRSFGDDPSLVTDYAAAALEGYREAGIISTLKHFPGLGAISVDPHFDVPVNRSDLDELLGNDLAPFIALGSKADVVMTGHIVVEALDPDNCATLSKRTLGMLREVCGFEGVIMTDSLVMDAIRTSCTSIEEAAVRAIAAGCDLLLLGGKLLNESGPSQEVGCDKIRSIRHAVSDAVREGKIDVAQIDRSVGRILTLKQRLCFNDAPSPDKMMLRQKEHLALAQEVAKLSARTYSHEMSQAGVLKNGNPLIIAPSITEKAMNEIISETFDGRAHLMFYNTSNQSEEENKRIDALTISSDAVIFFSYNAWKSPVQRGLLASLASSGKPLFLIALADDEDLRLLPNLPAAIATYSPAPVSIQNGLNRLITLDKTSP